MGAPGPDGPAGSPPAIEIHGLVKDFAVGLRGLRLRAVDHVTLAVRPGEVFGLLGPNGSGKSTTIKLLLGLLEPTAGGCAIFGVPSGRVEARRDVGYLPEAPNFYRFLTGRELVAFYGRMCGLASAALRERVDEVVALVGLAGAADRRVGTYSKGMLQRIGLAQALVHDPRLLILDEPTAGVDPVGSAEMANLILGLKARGKTVLITSHLLGQIEDGWWRMARWWSCRGPKAVSPSRPTLCRRRRSPPCAPGWSRADTGSNPWRRCGGGWRRSFARTSGVERGKRGIAREHGAFFTAAGVVDRGQHPARGGTSALFSISAAARVRAHARRAVAA
jgi:ABC-2 type transport system ATP-binding protein